MQITTRKIPALALLALIMLPVPGHALNIVPVYVDGLGNWDSIGTSSADGRIAFNAAIAVWEALIPIDMTIDVTVTFDDFTANPDLNPDAIGVWQGAISGLSCSGAECLSRIDIRPDSSFVQHTIFFDTSDLGSLFFDATPDDVSDLAFEDFDAFSIALHEIGHMLGFTPFFYQADVFEAEGSTFFPWADLIDEFGVFDPFGLAVQMFGDLAHLAPTGVPGGAVMEPSIFNGERRMVSDLELQMLLRAYDFYGAVIPVPAALPLMLSALFGLALLRRRRA